MRALSSLINELSEEEAGAALLRCCGSHRWVNSMLSQRPFREDKGLYGAAEKIWFSLGQNDWLEAFSKHPRIGERNLEKTEASTRSWSQNEQSGVDNSDRETKDRLLAGNRAYEEKFGHVFLICATGKSACEMLESLEQRLGHDAGTEIKMAAREQSKITRLRLEKLVNQ